MSPFHFCTGTHLSRRTVLRGLGVALTLPLLDAMRPAFAKEPAGAAAPKRFVAICSTLGFHRPFLEPTKAGAGYEPTPYLLQMKDHLDKLTVLSGVSNPEQNGGNGHSCENTWLTAAKHPGLVGFKNTISVDQVMAAHFGPATRVPYLALSTVGQSLSWTSGGVQIPGESSPAKVFSRLFLQGTPAEIETQKRSLQRGRSVLDAVNQRAMGLQRQLGARDQDKLDQYLTSIRELETDLTESSAWLDRPKPKVEAAAPKDNPNRDDAAGRIRLMNQVMTLALQTDSTRVITFRVEGGGNVPVGIEGVTQGWHELSHHGKNPEKIEQLRKIEEAQFAAFGEFLGQLRGVQENGVPLIDRTAVVIGSNLGNASSHEWKNLPLVVAGGGFKHGQHLAFDQANNVPFSNLFVQLLQYVGVETDRFGTSTGTSVPGLA
jgi:BMFP domain-containing protein YqiC